MKKLLTFISMILFALSINRVVGLEYIKRLPSKLLGRHYRHTLWVSPFKRLSLEDQNNIQKIVIIFEQFLSHSQEFSAEIKGYLPSEVVHSNTNDWLIARANDGRTYRIYKINNIRWIDQLSVEQRIHLEKLVSVVKDVIEKYPYLMSLYYKDSDFGFLALQKYVSAQDFYKYCTYNSKQAVFKQAVEFYNPVALCFIIESFLIAQECRSKNETS